jgi:hypothetical protein
MGADHFIDHSPGLGFMLNLVELSLSPNLTENPYNATMEGVKDLCQETDAQSGLSGVFFFRVIPFFSFSSIQFFSFSLIRLVPSSSIPFLIYGSSFVP